MSNWGKAHINNTNGFGQANINSTNGYGSVYDVSSSGDTILNPVSPFADATVAFSLRDLGLGATNVVRVRRDSDNQEQDFTATQITDGTLLSFVGSGDGLVSTWYNQTGINNATQTLAAEQPKIVENGSLIFENGKPAVKSFNTSFLLIDSAQITNNASFFIVTENATQTSGASIHRPIITSNKDAYGPESKGYGIGLSRDNDNIIFQPPLTTNALVDLKLSLATNENQILITAIESGGRSDLFLNSTSNVNMTYLERTTDFFTKYIIFDDNFNGRHYRGNCSEIIVFNSEKTANRLNIENNINNYYAIY